MSNKKDLNLQPSIQESEINKRVFEDNLTGDPFKMAFEARRNVCNNQGTQIFNKNHKNYFNKDPDTEFLGQLTGDPMMIVHKNRSIERQKSIQKLDYQ